MRGSARGAPLAPAPTSEVIWALCSTAQLAPTIPHIDTMPQEEADAFQTTLDAAQVRARLARASPLPPLQCDDARAP